MRKLSLYLVAILLLGLSVFPATAQGNIVDVASGSDDYSILVQAVQAAELTDTLSSGGPYTVFAPNNDAFARLAATYGFEVEDLLADTELLSQLLLYHVIEGEVFTGQAISLVEGSASGEVLLPTLLEGTAVGISVVDGVVTLNRVVEVVAPNLDASNGVVHGINDVIFPGVLLESLQALGSGAGAVDGDSIYAIASSNPDLSTLAAAIDASGNADLLTIGFPFTVFAPTNEAFDALFAEIGLTAEEALEQPELLDTILRYHILEEQLDSAALSETESVTSVEGGELTFALVEPEMEEMAEEEEAEAEETEEAEATEEPMEEMAPPADLVINETATVVSADIVASNGIIHVIDTVLVPDAALDQLEVINITEGTIAGVARDTEGFSTLIAALQATGNIQLLDVGFPFTVFAPTDDAFDALFDELGISAEEALANTELLDTVLRYHILEEDLSLSDLALRSDDELTTVQGETLSLSASGGSLIINDTASVVMPDVEASNGTIHAIDAVLLPQAVTDMMAGGAEEVEEAAEEVEEEAAEATEEAAEETEEAAEETEEAAEEATEGTIVDVLAGDERFSTLVTVVDALGLSETLSDDGELTVFAPTNEAFDELFALLGIGASDALGFPELVEPLVLYHVVEGTVLAADVADGAEVTTLQGEVLVVSVSDDGVVLVTPLSEVAVTETDLVASNGVVHVVDGVLVPQQTIDDLASLGLSLGGE